MTRGREMVVRAKARAGRPGPTVVRPFAEAMVETFGPVEARKRLDGMLAALAVELPIVLGVPAFAAFKATVEAV